MARDSQSCPRFESKRQVSIYLPKEIVKWRDALTDRESRSLGAKRYHEILDAEGLAVVGERSDEGGNYYYLASKR